MLRVNSRRFRGQGALIDINALLRPLADENGIVRFPNAPDPTRVPANTLTARLNTDAPGV